VAATTLWLVETAAAAASRLIPCAVTEIAYSTLLNILSRCRLAALVLPDLLAPISLNFGWWTLRARTGDQEQ
jgi:hypothetical protein